MIGALAASGLADRCVVTSFEPEYIEKVKALDPGQQVGLLSDAKLL